MGTVKSDLITNAETTPITKTASARAKGRRHVIKGTLAVLTTDIDDDDIIHLCRIPTGAFVDEITIFNDDLDSGGSGLQMDIGLYDLSYTVKDRNAYCSANTQLTAADVNGTNLAFEARDIIKIDQAVWEDAADSVDPNTEYVISITIEQVASTAAAGNISFRVGYTID